MNPPTDDETEERTHHDEPMSSSHSTRSYGGIALVLLALMGITMFGAGPVVGVDATSNALHSGDVEPSSVFATNTDPVARCTVSDTSVQVGESVTIDASGSENADDYQYDKYGNEAFGEYTTQSSRLVSYAEPGTYNPQVKVWSYSGSETSDVAACGTITVTESTPTPTPTPTATPTPAPSAVAKCTVSETSVQVGESVTIDASDSENADDYQYDRYGGSSFGEYTAQSSRVVSYAEPGTYEPRVKVWSYSGGEDSDVAACGTITVTESTPTTTATPTSTVTPTPTATAAPTPTDSEASAPSTGATTPVPTAAATRTSSSSTGTAADGKAWFRVSPGDPTANDTVRLVAQPAVAQDAVAAHSWDVDGDGTVDRRGRVLELPTGTGGETTVTLTIERTNGSTASVTREVPISPDVAGETVTPERPAAGTGGTIPVAVLLALLLVLIAAVVVWSRRDR